MNKLCLVISMVSCALYSQNMAVRGYTPLLLGGLAVGGCCYLYHTYRLRKKEYYDTLASFRQAVKHLRDTARENNERRTIEFLRARVPAMCTLTEIEGALACMMSKRYATVTEKTEFSVALQARLPEFIQVEYQKICQKGDPKISISAYFKEVRETMNVRGYAITRYKGRYSSSEQEVHCELGFNYTQFYSSLCAKIAISLLSAVSDYFAARNDEVLLVPYDLWLCLKEHVGCIQGIGEIIYSYSAMSTKEVDDMRKRLRLLKFEFGRTRTECSELSSTMGFDIKNCEQKLCELYNLAMANLKGKLLIADSLLYGLNTFLLDSSGSTLNGAETNRTCQFNSPVRVSS